MKNVCGLFDPLSKNKTCNNNAIYCLINNNENVEIKRGICECI